MKTLTHIGLLVVFLVCALVGVLSAAPAGPPDAVSIQPANVAPGLTPAPQPVADPVVYITNTGACFHRGTCRCLAKSRYPIYRSVAIARGYRACKICKP